MKIELSFIFYRIENTLETLLFKLFSLENVYCLSYLLNYQSKNKIHVWKNFIKYKIKKRNIWLNNYHIWRLKGKKKNLDLHRDS